jgi:diamine N-acetyltransferase
MLSFQRLYADDTEDMANLQLVLEGAPAYSLQVKGHLPSPTDAEDLFDERPPGLSMEDKLVGGFWLNNQMVGCVEICKGYPTAHIAYIGLLLFTEKYQGYGYGREALVHIRALARSWHCHVLRIAVIETNDNALAFWKNEGFKGIYRKSVPGYIGDAIAMESHLQPPASGARRA